MTAPRAALPEELPALALLWEAGWHEAHDACAPPALIALRTSASFLPRLRAFGDALRVAGPVGAPLGLCVARGEEIDQLYVAPAARGTGLAAALLADGEARLAVAGVRVGWLACAIGNDRALRFYARNGWHGGPETIVLEGALEVEVNLLRKRLGTKEAAAMRYGLETLPAREVFPGFHGRFVHSAGMTFAWWEIAAGAEVPEHSHPHEQVVNVLEGELELVVDGVAHALRAGEIVAIPGGVLHSARGITECRVLDVFAPVREDYRALSDSGG